MSRPVDISVVPTVTKLLNAGGRPIHLRTGNTAERRSRRWRRLRVMMVGAIAASPLLRGAYLGSTTFIETDDGAVMRVGFRRWAEWFQTHDRSVALDYVRDWRVSTVFLGLDHGHGSGPPILYETMVFPMGSHADSACRRYATRTEALVGHAEIVARVIAGEFDSSVTDESETP